MRKILLKVVNLITSVTQNNSFVVVLSEMGGNRRLPVVIGGAEAQSIIVAMEKMKPGRPLTHDLLKNVMMTFDIELKEVVINRFLEGVFFSQLVCVRNGVEEVIDSRTSDAIAVALRFNCPIYTYSSIMDTAGMEVQELEEGGFPTGEELTREESESGLKGYSTEELENMLQEALEKEEYEKAASIRDELDHRRS